MGRAGENRKERHKKVVTAGTRSSAVHSGAAPEHAHDPRAGRQAKRADEAAVGNGHYSDPRLAPVAEARSLSNRDRYRIRLQRRVRPITRGCIAWNSAGGEEVSNALLRQAEISIANPLRAFYFFDSDGALRTMRLTN